MAVECCGIPQLCRERQIPVPVSSLCSLSCCEPREPGQRWEQGLGGHLGTYPSPLLHRGFCPSLSRASAIPELLLPRPSPSVQPCCSRTFLPKPWERCKNHHRLAGQIPPSSSQSPLPTAKNSPPPDPPPVGTPWHSPALGRHPELTLVYLSKVPMCCPDTDPSSSPSRSRCSSHICTESRASLSPPSGERAARVSTAQGACSPPSFSPEHQQRRQNLFFLATLAARPEKRCFRFSETAWMLSKNDKELPDSAWSEFPGFPGLGGSALIPLS